MLKTSFLSYFLEENLLENVKINLQQKQNHKEIFPCPILPQMCLLMIHLGHIALLADKVNKKTAGDQDSREKQKLADG